MINSISSWRQATGNRNAVEKATEKQKKKNLAHLKDNSAASLTSHKLMERMGLLALPNWQMMNV